LSAWTTRVRDGAAVLDGKVKVKWEGMEWRANSLNEKEIVRKRTKQYPGCAYVH